MAEEFEYLFRVVAKNCDREFERWTDALYHAKSLIPKCRSLFEDIRIFVGNELVWVYSRSHKYPQYLGAGNYDRLARLFIAEAMEEEEAAKEQEEVSDT
ncbi:conserved hypothetical protein [Hyella patelloides LEGE 07179]|uniref:Uncharacterized protein n=1 Tax=Hyella patelloides LEGE 07179 TaxID=945734 RepID=A0A563VU91_9CYAN|nr:hypothetical protein [Hyella patelloides]VEP14978.1 conserved hypothetical protein [Hyella patelloides LEGE 07179]